MISYTTVGTNDYDAAKGFYDALFSEIGVGQLWATDRFCGYGVSMDNPMFAVCKPWDENAATVGNGTMITLAAPNRQAVEIMHAKAIELGGADEGAPGERGNGFYIGYFRDLDGNKLAAFTMIKPE